MPILILSFLSLDDCRRLQEGSSGMVDGHYFSAFWRINLFLYCQNQ